MRKTNKNTFYRGKKFVWEISNKYGWPIEDKSLLRDVNINNLLEDKNSPDHIDIYLSIRASNYTADLHEDHDIYFRYHNGFLEFRRIKIKLNFKEAEDLIRKIIIDNGFEVKDTIYDITTFDGKLEGEIF